jgi:ribosomal protein L35AE/L33A
MNRLHLGRKLAILATAASLVGTGAAVAPAAASAHAGGKSCGSKSIAVSASGGKKVMVAVSLIRVSGGATCAQASAVISGYVVHKTPKGWTVKEGKFDVPHGLTAEMATKGKMMVRFALVGGRDE